MRTSNGEKPYTVSLIFQLTTDGLSDGNVWDFGFVRVQPKERFNIKGGKRYPVNSALAILGHPDVRKAITPSGIKVKIGKANRKLIVT
jgi:hypothetical protein